MYKVRPYGTELLSVHTMTEEEFADIDNLIPNPIVGDKAVIEDQDRDLILRKLFYTGSGWRIEEIMVYPKQDISYFKHMVIADNAAEEVYNGDDWIINWAVNGTGELVVGATCKNADARASRITMESGVTTVDSEVLQVTQNLYFTIASFQRGSLVQKTSIAMLSAIGGLEKGLCVEVTIHGNDSDECTLCIKAMNN